MGNFILHKKHAIFSFEFNSASGDRILISQDFHEKPNAQTAINKLRKFAAYAHHFIKKTNAAGQYYYEVLGETDEVLAISELFWSKDSRDYAIRIASKEVHNAGLIDRC